MNPIDRVDANLDKELRWIATETVHSLFARADGKDVTRGDIYKAVAHTVGSTLIGRLPENQQEITVDEFASLANKIFNRMGGNSMTAGAENFAEYLTMNFVMYAELRTQGMQCPYPKPGRRSAYDDFDPFSLPGGFCNPIKLKLLHEESGPDF